MSTRHFSGHRHPHMLEPVKISNDSPSPVDPVTRAEAKTHTRIDSDDENSYIDDLIKAATEKLSGWRGHLGNVVLITETWRVDFDQFPGTRRLMLPMEPVQSVTVQYYDSDNTLQTHAASKYALHDDVLGPFLWLDEAEDAWPDTYDRMDAVKITMQLGYGDTASDVPRPIRMAILHMVARLHEDRFASEMPPESESILAEFRNAHFG